MERKYSHRGYMDSNAPQKKEKRPQEIARRRNSSGLARRAWWAESRAAVVELRCGAPAGFDLTANAALRFRAAQLQAVRALRYRAQFECTEPIPERIAKKDARNECPFYAFRMTVEKDTAPTAVAPSSSAAAAPSTSYRPNDARKAFDDLFKK